MTSPDVKRCPRQFCELNLEDGHHNSMALLKCGHGFHTFCLEIFFTFQKRIHQDLHCPMCSHSANFVLSKIRPHPIFQNNYLRVKYNNDMTHDLASYNLAPTKTSLIKQRS
ncbi:MAG: hypothetical protein V4629_00955 [Pseudomonadota bacterium]